MIQYLICLLLTFENWLGLITLIIAFLAVDATIFSVVQAQQYWKRQKVVERNMQLEANVYQKFLEAHAAAWKLLAYLTKAENKKNIILYKGSKATPEYFFIKDNAVAFIEALSEIFYDQGHGLFLSAETKDKLYHTRGIVYGFLLRSKTEKNTSPEIKIENPGFVTAIEQQYEELRAFLKAAAFPEKKDA